MDEKIDHFCLFYRPFSGKLNEIIHVTYSTLFEKHNKLYYIVIGLMDFERNQI